jgi:hypothetical protein
MTMSTPTESSADDRHRIALAAAAALLAAGLIFVMFVLPAEYGIDPLGTGARFGLLELGLTGQQVEAMEAAAAAGGGPGQPIVVPQERAFQAETVEFTIAAGEWVEYKYRLDKGEALLYSWKATAPVNFEFHAEPDSGPRGYAQTYEKGSGTSEASGTMNAPFSGIHGWWWENATGQEVTVTLTASGFYNMSHEFREGAPVRNKTF